jgi:hypothetical protein
MTSTPAVTCRLMVGLLAAMAIVRPPRAAALQVSGVIDLGAGSATWDQGGPGMALTRGAFEAAYRAPSFHGLTPELTGGVGASTDPASRTAVGWDLGARLTAGSGLAHGWLAAALGRAGVGAPTVALTRLESGIRGTVGPAGVQFWASRTVFGARNTLGGVNDSLAGRDTVPARRLADYTDLGSRATLGFGGIDLAVSVVRRLGVGPRRVAWETSAVWWLAPGVGLAGAAGHSLPQFGLVIPGARYGTLGLRLALGAEARGRRHTPPTPPPPPARAAAGLVVTPDRHLAIVGPAAARAEVRGDFTDWTPTGLEPQGPGRWRLGSALSPGVHHLDVRFDGGPWLVPAGAVPTDDGFGGRVGLVVVP